MGAFQVIKKGVAAGWNFSAWLGTKNIKDNALLIKDLSQSAFKPGKADADSEPKKETFAQAMKRLNINEAGLKKRIRASGQVIFFCGILTIPMLAYTIYMFMSGFYLSSFVCLMLTPYWALIRFASILTVTRCAGGGWAVLSPSGLKTHCV